MKHLRHFVCLVVSLLFVALAVRSVHAQGARQDFPAGHDPRGLAFDGKYIYVANAGGTITKLRPSDGAIVATFPVGAPAADVVFDGVNLWVANDWYGTVTKLRAKDGTNLGVFPTPLGAACLAFNAKTQSIWVAFGGGYIVKLRASDGANLGTFVVGNGSYGSCRMVSAGDNMWIPNHGDSTVVELRAADGLQLGVYATGWYPWGITFDGRNIWIANVWDNSVTKLSTDGKNLGTFPAGLDPIDVAYVAGTVWIANNGYPANPRDTVTVLRANGSFTATLPTQRNPNSILSDGTYIWVTNRLDDTVSKFTP